MTDTKADITLIIDRRCVGKFVGLKPHQGCGLALTILKRANDVSLQRATEIQSFSFEVFRGFLSGFEPAKPMSSMYFIPKPLLT